MTNYLEIILQTFCVSSATRSKIKAIYDVDQELKHKISIFSLISARVSKFIKFCLSIFRLTGKDRERIPPERVQ